MCNTPTALSGWSFSIFMVQNSFMENLVKWQACWMSWRSFIFLSWDKVVITTLPCTRRLTDSKIATPLAPIFPLGVTPSPPISPAHKSLKKTNKFFHLQLHLCKVLKCFYFSFSCNYNLFYIPTQSENKIEEEQMLLAACTPLEHVKICITTSRRELNKIKRKFQTLE